MQRSCLLFVVTFLLLSVADGQQKNLSKAEKKSLDSMLQKDDFLNLLKEKKQSYFDISLGMSNGVFSLKNNTLNADQAETNQISYTPTVGYYHKTGLAISANCFLTFDKGKLKVYQYAVTPSYTFENKSINASVSYTRFFSGENTSFEISPFQNDIYAEASYKKTWIEPGITVGYSFGKSTEHFDSSFWFVPPLPFQPRLVHITDTITTKLSAFSLTAKASHEWDFEHLLSKKDAITIQPTLFLNAGSQHWNISHSSSLNRRRAIVQNQLKDRYGNGSSSESFTLQSIAFLADITYYFGKFYLQPQLYLDYYLPTTTGNRFTALYSVVIGINF